MSLYSGTFTDCLFSYANDFTALASSASEGTLLAGPNLQPRFPAGFFDRRGYKSDVAVRVHGAGVISCTGTPTFTLQCRLGTSQGSSQLGGTSVGVSPAITLQSGVSNKQFEFYLDILVKSLGEGSGNTTLTCVGRVQSFGGFASPFSYALQPSSPEQATWTATIDPTVDQWFNLSATWSASSSSNTATLKVLEALCWN